MKVKSMKKGDKYQVGVIVGKYIGMSGKFIVLEQEDGSLVNANPYDTIKKYTPVKESLYATTRVCRKCNQRKSEKEFRRTKNNCRTKTCAECLAKQSESYYGMLKRRKEAEKNEQN